MTIFLVEIFCRSWKRGWRKIRNPVGSLSLGPHELNIDMKMIRLVNLLVLRLVLTRTLGLGCKAAICESWEIFHSNSTGSPSFVSKVCIVMNFLNHVNLSSQTLFDGGFSHSSLQSMTQNLKLPKPLRARD